MIPSVTLELVDMMVATAIFLQPLHLHLPHLLPSAAALVATRSITAPIGPATVAAILSVTRGLAITMAVIAAPQRLRHLGVAPEVIHSTIAQDEPETDVAIPSAILRRVALMAVTAENLPRADIYRLRRPEKVIKKHKSLKLEYMYGRNKLRFVT